MTEPPRNDHAAADAANDLAANAAGGPKIVAGTHSPMVSSADLLRGGHELLIEHHGELYRLRLTRSGKLILHK